MAKRGPAGGHRLEVVQHHTGGSTEIWGLLGFNGWVRGDLMTTIWQIHVGMSENCVDMRIIIGIMIAI